MENSIFVPQIHQVQICKSMQKLKFELVNGYGVLVDENIECPEDSRVWNISLKTNMVFRGYRKDFGHNADTTVRQIIFAQKELNLEGIPVFEWRDFELNKLSTNFAMGGSWQCPISFEVGYKSNPAKYTEEDLMKIISGIESLNKETNSAYEYELGKIEIMQSLQKYPKYVVMESELVDSGNHGSGEIFHNNRTEEFTLFTNSEGKQQGTAKKLIWE